MSLSHLVQAVRRVRRTNRNRAGLKIRDWASFVLTTEFGTKPTPEEIQELCTAVKKAIREDRGLPRRLPPTADGADEQPAYQTRGGRRVVHKSEPLAG